MKRTPIRLLILVLLTALLCALAAAACAEVEHEHSWRLSKTISFPTCTEAGRGIYSCECGEIKREDIPALGHNWSNWKTITKATCTKNGVRFRICSRCGQKQKRTIKATGKHKYKWKIVKKPTCGKIGIRQKVCTVCGHKGIKKKIAKTGKHKFGKWKVTKKPTCTKVGQRTRTCSVCGKKQKIKIKATGHDWDDGVVTKPAGFLESGIKTYTCKKCGKEITEELPVIQSAYSDGGSILDMLRNKRYINEVTALITREQPDAYMPAEPMADVQLNQFAGYWKSVYTDRNGVTVPAATGVDATDLYIDGHSAILGGPVLGDTQVKLAFENGMLTCENGGSSVQILYQTDGYLRLTVTGSDKTSNIWYMALLIPDEEGEEKQP